jgi:hypothetical protein
VHIVTKILVIFAAILSVFLAALAIAYSSNADRIVGDYNAEQSRRVAAEGQLGVTKSTHAMALQESQAQVEQLRRELTQRDEESRRLQSENAKLARERAAAEDERAQVVSKIGELGETVKTQQTLLSAYSKEVGDLRRNELTYRGRELDMADRISDLEAKNEVLNQSMRALAEQLTEARNALGSGVAAGAMGPQGGGAFTFAGPIIAGRVTAVKQDSATNDTLVTINVGTNDQVREHMKFAVHRNGQFLANIEIVKADQRMSVGKVTLRAANAAEITANDLVQTRFER